MRPSRWPAKSMILFLFLMSFLAQNKQAICGNEKLCGRNWNVPELIAPEYAMKPFLLVDVRDEGKYILHQTQPSGESSKTPDEEEREKQDKAWLMLMNSTVFIEHHNPHFPPHSPHPDDQFPYRNRH